MTPERWQKLTYWPLIVASFAFIVAYSWQVIAELRGGPRIITATIILVTWVVFAADYLVQLSMAPKKGVWFRAHLFALAVVIIPALKPLRLLRVLTLFHPFGRSAGDALRARLMIYGVASALMVIYIAALSVLEAERASPDANITSFGDAIWWAFVTITTVGYGDFTPVTVAGRVVAVLLMFSGVAVLGISTATLASWVAERATAGHEEYQPATRAEVSRLSAQLAALGAPADPPAPPRSPDA
ncbi:potassium channel family protein [Microbacterium sp. CJ77]|uniref:potassium channel family protein n=1 Tax=Microbacterium sp. CJ77 TaxID=2079201 RepID=UPI000CD978D2|nr:potassium channel family protein [Microbacterium sp. CJ77]